MSELNLKTPDSEGNVPDLSWIGNRITHRKNRKAYVIHGFAWMGESDRWGFVHEEHGGGVSLVRPLSHRFGLRSDGLTRYL